MCTSHWRRVTQEEVLMLNVRNPRTDVLKLCVWDADVLSKDDAIGRCEVPLQLVREQESGSLFQELLLGGQH